MAKKTNQRFTNYTEFPDTRTSQLYNQFQKDKSYPPYCSSEDPSTWDIDKKYKDYYEQDYQQAKLTKEEYSKLVRDAISLQNKKLSQKEGDYLLEIYRALEPLVQKDKLRVLALDVEFEHKNKTKKMKRRKAKR